MGEVELTSGRPDLSRDRNLWFRRRFHLAQRCLSDEATVGATDTQTKLT
jgi:hypothetical protein